jgi:DNA-binding MarR family transcriptional regulator
MRAGYHAVVADRPPAVLTWRSWHLVDGIVRDQLNARLVGEAGCSLVEHDVLAWLGAASDGRLRMLDLAARLRVTPGGLTRIVDRLVDRGWIERDHPEANRREVHATLTAAGTGALRRTRAVYARVIEETFAGHLDDGDLRALDRISRRLLDKLASPQLCPGDP